MPVTEDSQPELRYQSVGNQHKSVNKVDKAKLTIVQYVCDPGNAGIDATNPGDSPSIVNVDAIC